MFGSTAPHNATQLTNGCNDYLLFLALEPPDLPVKQPDLDITAVYKLPETTHGGMELMEGGHAGTEWNRRACARKAARKLLIGKAIVEV